MSHIIRIPLFPLNGAIFFPETNLPLNIFEKRYLDMIDYALSNNKIIGIIQSMNDSKLYSTGCAGKITRFIESTDGRYIINLKGIYLFRIFKEINTNNKFRVFDIKIFENNSKLEFLDKDKFNKQIFIKKFKYFFQAKETEIDFKLIEKIKSKDLIKLIAMTCPFSTNEKQALLESSNLNVLADNLLSLFEFYKNENFDAKKIN